MCADRALAFLGSAYDPQLKEVYTSYGVQEIARRRPLILIVAEASVGKGLVMKRFQTRGRGRAAGIIKPFSHLTIVVRERAEAEDK